MKAAEFFRNVFLTSIIENDIDDSTNYMMKLT